MIDARKYHHETLDAIHDDTYACCVVSGEGWFNQGIKGQASAIGNSIALGSVLRCIRSSHTTHPILAQGHGWYVGLSDEQVHLTPDNAVG